MQTNNGENESQAQNQNHNGVDAQTGALVSVELQHGARRTAGTGRASRAGTGIAEGLLVVGGRATTHSSPGTTRRSRRGRAVHGSGRSRGDGGAASLGVGTGLSTGGHGRSSTGRGLRRRWDGISAGVP